MAQWYHFVSAVSGRRVIVALGGLYLLLAVGQIFRITVAGESLVEAVSSFILVGVPGLLLLYGGYRLPDTSLHPETYPRIAAWCLGGFGLLLGGVGLRILNPGVTIDNPFWSIVLATALGTIAGLGIGLNEARAFSRAQEAQQHSHELEQTKAELEQQNRELQRTQSELEETVDHLRTSNERLEQFAYAASHDLQEPLRMVSSYLQLLENRYAANLDAEAEEYIDYAVGGAERMRAMVESLLEYSRITTRGKSLEPTNAEEVLGHVLDDLYLRIEEADATITTDELPTVTADSDQLAQVFQNLLSNALKYSGDEPPRVHVGVERADDKWRFAVSDEGIGIESEYHGRIFNVFEQLHTGEKEAEVGAGGIGLALCERIIERHDGGIWVESDPDEGATFYFTIPITEEQQSESTAQSSIHG